MRMPNTKQRALGVACLLTAYFGLTFQKAATASELPASPFAERIHFFRFLEDYSDVTPEDRASDAFAAIKNIPIGTNGVFLSLGGDYRYRYEKFNDALFTLGPVADYEQHLHRMLVHGDLHVGSAFRAFVQLSAFEEYGHPLGAGPFDESAPDLQQAFVDLGSKDAQLRIGRQEVVIGSGKLTDIREGPNQRQAFDGVRGTLAVGGGASVDAFYVRDVLPDKDAFSDSSDGGTKFWGLYGSKLTSPWLGAELDIYYLGIDRAQAIYQSGLAEERRHSIGGRLFGAAGAFSYEYESIYQFGKFGNFGVSAWGIRTEHYYIFRNAPFSPRVGLVANATSGDSDRADGTLGTFDALFPNPAYTTDASIFRPRNFYELHPVVSLDITKNVNLLFEWNFLWRMEEADAVYAVPGFPIVPAAASDERYIGNVFDIIVTWRMSPHLTLQASYVHASAGDVIKDAGGKDIDFLLFQSLFKF